MSTHLLIGLLCGSLLVFVVGCSSTPKGPQPIGLDGTSWRLIAWNIAAIDPNEFEITMEIAGDRVAGKSAVNRYFGPVEIGDDGTFTVGLVGSTMMAGPEPAMAAEQAFTGLLPQSRRYGIVNGELRLFAEDGTQIMAFRPES